MKVYTCRTESFIAAICTAVRSSLQLSVSTFLEINASTNNNDNLEMLDGGAPLAGDCYWLFACIFTVYNSLEKACGKSKEG